MSSTNHEAAAARQSLGDLTNADQEKKEKERFLIFMRVLMKYLEQRDLSMHAKAKAVIKECYEKNMAGDPNYPSVETSLKTRLREKVGEHYWKKAEQYLNHFLKIKREEKERFDLLVKKGLMCYLEEHDTPMYEQALVILKQCRKESHTESQLRNTVGEEYWDKGHQYFRRHLRMTMNPSPTTNQIVNPRPNKRLRCDELPTSFDLKELYQSGIGKTILSYASSADLCALDLVNKEFNVLTTDQWKVVTKDRFGMDNGKEGWKIGTSFLQPPVFVHNPGGRKRVTLWRQTLSIPRITTNGNIVVDVSSSDRPLSFVADIGIRSASNLEYIKRNVSSERSNIPIGKVAICGQVGSEIIVISNHTKICAQIGGIAHYHVHKWEYDNRSSYNKIETLGCETHLIVAHDGRIQLFEVNEQQVRQGDNNKNTELLSLRKDIRVEEGAKNRDAYIDEKLAWAPDKKHFIVGYPHQICVWKFEAANNDITLIKTIDVTNWEVTNVALAEDYIVASSNNKKVHIWNRSTGDKMVYELQQGGKTRDALCDVGIGHQRRYEDDEDTFIEEVIHPLCFSCHGHILVSTSHIGCAICIWDMKTGELLKRHNEANEEGVVGMLTESGSGNDVTDMVHLERLNAFSCMGEKEYMWVFPTNQAQSDMAQSIRRHKDMFPKYEAFRTSVRD